MKDIYKWSGSLLSDSAKDFSNYFVARQDALLCEMLAQSLKSPSGSH